MKRNYSKAIDVLIDIKHRELADDINDYVNYIEHERVVLINELSRCDTMGAKSLLTRPGFKPKSKIQSKQP